MLLRDRPNYPEVPLKLARERRDAARAQVAAGVDPSASSVEERQERELLVQLDASEIGN